MVVQDELDRASVEPPLEPASQSWTPQLTWPDVAEGALFLMKSNQRKYGRLVQELANDFNKGRAGTGRAHVYIQLMLHDARDQTRLFRRMRLRDGIQCRERRRASSYTTAKAATGRARTILFEPVDRERLLQQEDIRHRTHAGSIAMQERWMPR
jgi:hypothetical protein